MRRIRSFCSGAAHRRVPGVCFSLCFAGLLCFSNVRAQSDDSVPDSVEALIYSTMPSTAAHRPEMALDGDPNTYFKTVYGMGDGDDFLILLSRPIPLQSVHIITGDT